MCETIHLVGFLTMAVSLEHSLQPFIFCALAFREFEGLLDTIFVKPPEHPEKYFVTRGYILAERGSPLRQWLGLEAVATDRQRGRYSVLRKVAAALHRDCVDDTNMLAATLRPALREEKARWYCIRQ